MLVPLQHVGVAYRAGAHRLSHCQSALVNACQAETARQADGGTGCVSRTGNDALAHAFRERLGSGRTPRLAAQRETTDWPDAYTPWTKRLSMSKAAGSIRLLLASVFLLARMALGFAAPVQPCPAATHASTVAHSSNHHVAGASSTKGFEDTPGHPATAVPCCCGSGLSGTALGVLPSPLPLERLAASSLAFAPDRASDIRGIRASPALPPPRS